MIYNDEQKAHKLITYLCCTASTLQEAVDIFNDHSIHISTKTHNELLELVKEHL